MDRLQSDIDREILGYSNLTDWFVHEGRNSFATINKIPGYRWSKEMYEDGREQLKNVLNAFDRFPDEGKIPKSEIEKFILESTSKEWNAKNVRGIWKQFGELIEEAIKDDLK